jgi:hypothetical protein
MNGSATVDLRWCRDYQHSDTWPNDTRGDNKYVTFLDCKIDDISAILSIVAPDI